MDKRLINKASLWILRIILNLGDHREFINKENYISSDIILAFLNGNHFLNPEVNELMSAEEDNKLRREKVLFLIHFRSSKYSN